MSYLTLAIERAWLINHWLRQAGFSKLQFFCGIEVVSSCYLWGSDQSLHPTSARLCSASARAVSLTEIAVWWRCEESAYKLLLGT